MCLDCWERGNDTGHEEDWRRMRKTRTPHTLRGRKITQAQGFGSFIQIHSVKGIFLIIAQLVLYGAFMMRPSLTHPSSFGEPLPCCFFFTIMCAYLAASCFYRIPNMTFNESNFNARRRQENRKRTPVILRRLYATITS